MLLGMLLTLIIEIDHFGIVVTDMNSLGYIEVIYPLSCKCHKMSINRFIETGVRYSDLRVCLGSYFGFISG